MNKMIKIVQKEKCSGCSACAAVCPKHCITMSKDNEGFLYPEIDMSLCVDCGLCENRCPVLNKNTEKEERCPVAFAARSKDERIVSKSSSGGIFSEFAEKILIDGGVVFGAVCNEELLVNHTFIEKREDLFKLQGSKYIQSVIGSSYTDAKGFLDSGRVVLFTGTPCQIAGLYSFLDKPYSNLITQDVICHGVPSPLMWRSYIKKREKIAQSKVTKVSFRHKSSGWKNYSMKVDFSNGTSYEREHSKDEFFKCFLSDACLRPSCHSCAFKGKSRQSDVTLADFWGVENISEQMNGNEGTSLVVINSSAGAELFDNIKDKIICEKVKLDEAIKYNSAMMKSASVNEKRQQFMKVLNDKGIVEAEKLIRIGLIDKIKGKIKLILKINK